jgi:hypothetical protein
MPATSRPSRRKCNRARPTARATPVTPPALSARRPISSPPLCGNRASQPISINASQPVNLDVSSCDTSPVQAMAETFESQLMGTQAVRPTNPSVIAGAATAEVASVAAADDASTVFGDAHLQDNFDGIDWSRLPRFMIPPTTPRSRRSWIYRHGYRVALISDPSRVFFICHYCHARKIIDCGGSGAFETTLSTSCSARHLEARKAGHGHRAPGRHAHFRQQDSSARGQVTVSRALQETSLLLGLSYITINLQFNLPIRRLIGLQSKPTTPKTVCNPSFCSQIDWLDCWQVW